MKAEPSSRPDPRSVAAHRRRAAALFVCLVALVFTVVHLALQSAERAPSRPRQTGVVTHVVDGDTIDVALATGVVRVRLLGVDTPESVDPRRPVECFGPETSAFVRDRIEGDTVMLERDILSDDADEYGRLLRYVVLEDGAELGALLLDAGYAEAYRAFSYAKKPAYLAREAKARTAKQGMWGACSTAP